VSVENGRRLSATAQAAADFAAAGFSIFPLLPGEKRPHKLAPNGFKDASADPEQIAAWWREAPKANVGLWPGGSGLLVLDVDVKKGAGGLESLASLEAQHGPLPACPVVETPSGGLHYYFRVPAGRTFDNKTGSLPKGIDVRSASGYVVAPPSWSVAEKKAYRWREGAGLDLGFPEMPAWLVDALTPKPRAVQRPAAPVHFAPRGDEFERLAELLPHLGAHRVEVRNEWLHVGMALHSADGGGQRGLAAWDAWSRQCVAKYSPDACAKEWNSFKAGEGIGAGSIVFWAREDSGNPNLGKLPEAEKRLPPRPAAKLSTDERRHRLEEIAKRAPAEWSRALWSLFEGEAGEDRLAADALCAEVVAALPAVGKAAVKDIAKQVREALAAKREKEKKAREQSAQRLAAERAQARDAKTWHLARSQKRPEFEAREAHNGDGLEVVRWSRSRATGEDFAEVLATGVFRVAEIRRAANKESAPVAVFEVRCGENVSRFEADPGAPMTRDWLATLRREVPGLVLASCGATVDALNFLADEIAQTAPPIDTTTHAPGFAADLLSYRVPGWVVTAGGFMREGGSDVCPRGFGEDEQGGGFTPDAIAAADAAQTFAEAWPVLYPSPIDATIALAGGLCGPFAAPLSGSPCNLLMAFTGGTGSGKTTNARLLRLLHGLSGDPNSRNTLKGALLAGQVCRDSLAFVDDLREGKSMEDFIGSAFDGSRRLSSTRDQKLARSPSLRCATILTAETLCGGAQSTENRLVAIRFAPAKPEAIPAINAAKPRLFGLKNPSALAAETVRLALALGKDRLRAQLRHLKQAAETHPSKTSPRGRDLAALVGLCVQMLEAVFVEMLGEAPAWLASPAACMDRAMDAHEAAEEQAKPHVRFLEALREAMGARADFHVVPCRWAGPEEKAVQPLGDANRPADRGQTLLLRIADDGAPGGWLLVPPRSTLQALRIEDLTEGQIKESLVNAGMMRASKDPRHPRHKVWVKDFGLEVTGWLIRDAAPATATEAPGTGGNAPRKAWLQTTRNLVGKLSGGLSVEQTQFPPRADTVLPTTDNLLSRREPSTREAKISYSGSGRDGTAQKKNSPAPCDSSKNLVGAVGCREIGASPIANSVSPTDNPPDNFPTTPDNPAPATIDLEQLTQADDAPDPISPEGIEARLSLSPRGSDILAAARCAGHTPREALAFALAFEREEREKEASHDRG
jgi:hypothetical protein